MASLPKGGGSTGTRDEVEYQLKRLFLHGGDGQVQLRKAPLTVHQAGPGRRVSPEGPDLKPTKPERQGVGNQWKTDRTTMAGISMVKAPTPLCVKVMTLSFWPGGLSSAGEKTTVARSASMEGAKGGFTGEPGISLSMAGRD